jgi:hypothetical protein
MTYSVLKSDRTVFRNSVIMLNLHGYTVKINSDAKDRISMRDSIC